MGKKFATILLIFLMVLALAALPLVAGCAEEELKEPYKIGVLSMLTGAMARTEFGDAARLAAEEINAAGGINGHPLVIIEEDDGGSPETGVRAFTKLTDKDKVICVVGCLFSHVASALQPMAEEKKVSLITPNIAAYLDVTGGPYYFRVEATDGFGFKLLLEYVLTLIPPEELKAGIIHDKGTMGVSQRDAFLKVMEEEGLEPVGIESFEFGVETYIPYLTHLREADANVLMLASKTTPPHLGIERDRAVMGWEPVRVGGLGYGDVAGYNASGGTWDFASYWSSFDPEKPEVIELAEKFMGMGQDYPSSSVMNFYQLTTLAAEVMKKSGPDREKFRDTLETFRWDAPFFGPPDYVLQFSPEDHSPLPYEGHVIVQWQPGGALKTVYRVE